MPFRGFIEKLPRHAVNETTRLGPGDTVPPRLNPACHFIEGELRKCGAAGESAPDD